MSMYFLSQCTVKLCQILAILGIFVQEFNRLKTVAGCSFAAVSSYTILRNGDLFGLIITVHYKHYFVITRDGGKWWSKDHHLVVVKILKNVDFSLKNVKKWWKKVIIFFVKIIIIKTNFYFLYKFKTFYLQLSLKHNVRVHMIRDRRNRWKNFHL